MHSIMITTSKWNKHGPSSVIMDTHSLHNLLDRKMATCNPGEAPPPRADPDAPPRYQPSSQDASTSTTISSRPSQPHNGIGTQSPDPRTTLTAYADPVHAHPRQSSFTGPGPEISIPFYSNPPPAQDQDYKPPILADLPPSTSARAVDKSPAFAALTLLSNDRLGSTNFSSEITNELDRVIRAKWAKGVQKWAFEDGGWCWQLQGKPCMSFIIITKPTISHT